MIYEEWESSVPQTIRGDLLWRVQAYRLALFFADLSWADATKLLGDARTKGIADQVYRAVGKISSNVAEGYSRDTGKGRAQFYDYAQGSAREARDWYYKARHVLGQEVTDHRLDLATRITKLLLKMAATDRRTNDKLSKASSGIRHQASTPSHEPSSGDGSR